MVEVYLFIVVGAVAIIAAALMLLSENAVHSAMFLILNFACVAFLYLMLNAPFLAMVQLAVYAGAIMVLFLFVIMLLGAEQAETPISPMSNEPGSRFHTWVALGLALVMLLAVAVGIGRGDVDTLENNGPPMLRVVHAASLTEFVDVTLDGEVLKNDVAFRETTGFTEIEAGTHIIEVLDTDTEEVVWSGEVEVEAPAYPEPSTQLSSTAWKKPRFSRSLRTSAPRRNARHALPYLTPLASLSPFRMLASSGVMVTHVSWLLRYSLAK
jgi:NADH:ubiquinone oxidoreductase subunit 6 (subunit J)